MIFFKVKVDIPSLLIKQKHNITGPFSQVTERYESEKQEFVQIKLDVILNHSQKINMPKASYLRNQNYRYHAHARYHKAPPPSAPGRLTEVIENLQVKKLLNI